MDLPKHLQAEELLAETAMVRRLALALVRQHDLAADVVQDVMLTALRQQQPPRNLRGWLVTLTRRLAMRQNRRQRERQRHEAAVARPDGGDADRRGLERLRLYRRLTDAVLALPEPYLTTVTLRFFDELPPRAIAQRLGTSSEVVRKRLQRGLEMLRAKLDGEFGDRTQWVRAFAAVGLLPVGSSAVLLTVLAMNKLALTAAAALAVGAYLLWSPAPPAPDTNDVLAAGPIADTAAASVPTSNEPSTVRTAAATPTVAPTEPPAVPECAVVVVDDRDRPIEGALVTEWANDSQDWLERTTAANGRCSFGDLAGPGGVLVAADGHFPLQVALAQRRGEHRIALPQGDRIDGTLIVDGQPGVGYRLRLRNAPFDDSLPKALRLRYVLRGVGAVTGKGGTFRFDGVPRGWRGWVELPRCLWFTELDDDNGRRPIATPAHGVELSTTRLPTVRGRVLWSDTGEPVAFPSVSGSADFVDGQDSPWIGHIGYADGTFALGFYGSHPSRAGEWLVPARRPATQRVRLTIEDQDQTATTSLELDASRLGDDREILVRLDRAPGTHFRCVDEAGQPIAGARLAARNLSAKTDADGRGSFAGTADEVKLVGSPQHRIGPVEPRGKPAGTLADPLVFVLSPTNVVRFHLDGRNPKGQRCKLRSDQPLFAGKRSGGELDKVLHGGEWSNTASGRTQADGSTAWYDHRVELSLDEHGEAALWSLEPGTRCEFQVLDDFGRSMAARTFRVPAFGDELDVRLHATTKTAPFAGRVVDEAGRPVADVGVTFRTEQPGADTHFASCTTDARGTFALRQPGDLAFVRLELHADGFAEQWHRDLVAGGAPQTYTLQRGRQLTLQVVDERDQPLELVPVWQDEREEQRDWVRKGVYRWRNMPAGLVKIGVRIGADLFAIDVDTSTPLATLRVPRPARLRIASPNGWPEVTDARNAIVAVLRSVGGGHQDVRIWRPKDAEPKWLLPGTWRIELVEWSRPASSAPAVERALGLSAEVTLRAGDDTTAQLR